MERFIYWQKIRSKLPVLVFDVASIPFAWYLSYWLRFNMQIIPKSLFTHEAITALFILSIVQVSCYFHCKVYRGLWRFSSMNDVTRILRSVISATFIAMPLFYLCSLLAYIPRSILPLYCIILITFLCGARLLFRSYWERNQHHSVTNIPRVLVIGAGQAGESIIREMKRTQTYLPIGLVDDNLNKKGLEVHGVRVLGRVRDLRDLVAQYPVDLIFIAIPSARSASMRRIVEHCEHCNIPFRTLPAVEAFVSNPVAVNALRKVDIEDLLGRDQVTLHWDKIAAHIHNRCVLVTGGGGSIGSELCRQIMNLQPCRLVILDNSEFNLYQIELELKECYPNIALSLALVSVVDEVAIERVFQTFQPEIVFHAASYKHVPMLEGQLRVAIQNNILGTQVVALASVKAKVIQFILISTDKAVNPTSIMGTTKRAAELYCQNLNALVETQFITVRFGNVLGSVGSVVPLFQKQLQHGGPLTVTHPDIQRYFMTIAEACQLILQAMINGAGGEIFVLDMGEPIKIDYLAQQMIRLAGKEPGKDIQIQYTGLRPGEKLFEELFHEAERLIPTEHEKLFKAQSRPLDWAELSQAMHLLNKACKTYQDEELFILLRNLVPEFRHELNFIPSVEEIL